mmetsp:Transcript_49909/g.97893  ORF Transcript_49909/g.97893 Transcript_49909/m.97893 type:complete len:128 (+) Transcript_49909:204-587(+)
MVEETKLSSAEEEPNLYPHFCFTPWNNDPRSRVNDSTIDRWISEGVSMVDTVGGYERSIPEIDEMADELSREFEDRAAMRVSAAGLGGRVCIHAFAEVADEVGKYLETRGWKVRSVHPGSATQFLNC